MGLFCECNKNTERLENELFKFKIGIESCRICKCLIERKTAFEVYIENQHGSSYIYYCLKCAPTYNKMTESMDGKRFYRFIEKREEEVDENGNIVGNTIHIWKTKKNK